MLDLFSDSYTQFKLIGLAANDYQDFYDHHITEDIQMAPAPLTAGHKTVGGGGHKTRGRKTSKTQQSPLTSPAPSLDPTVWQVTRSVELDNCDERVEHQVSNALILIFK